MSNPPSAPTPPELQPTETCAVSGKRYPRREMVQYEGKWIAAEHKDAYFQRLREGVKPRSNQRYGGFWIRLGAKIIDGILLALVNSLFLMFVASAFYHTTYHFFSLHHFSGISVADALALNMISVLFGIAVKLIYECVTIRQFDATLGKLACGLRLLRPDGSKLGVGRIIGRMFAEYISIIILFIGYMMAGWDDEKRSLHDRICDTRVVYAK